MGFWGRAKLTCCIFDSLIPNTGTYGFYFALFGPKTIDIGSVPFCSRHIYNALFGLQKCNIALI